MQKHATQRNNTENVTIVRNITCTQTKKHRLGVA
jgi:hypothetical protein